MKQLPPVDRERPLAFCQWLLARPEHILEDLLIGHEEGFALNVRVNTGIIDPVANNHMTLPTIAIINPFFFENLNGDEYVRMIDRDVVPVI